MEQVFTMLKYPDTLVPDRDTHFTSTDFELYLQTYNIDHQLTYPYWSLVNGEVQRVDKTITKTNKCVLAEARDWKEPLQQFFLT